VRHAAVRSALRGEPGGLLPRLQVSSTLTFLHCTGPGRKPGASLYTRKRLSLVLSGARASAWCLLTSIPSNAYISISLFYLSDSHHRNFSTCDVTGVMSRLSSLVFVRLTQPCSLYFFPAGARIFAWRTRLASVGGAGCPQVDLWLPQVDPRLPPGCPQVDPRWTQGCPQVAPRLTPG